MFGTFQNFLIHFSVFSNSNDWNCRRMQLRKCERIRVELTAGLNQSKWLKYSNEKLTLKEASELFIFIFLWKSEPFPRGKIKYFVVIWTFSYSVILPKKYLKKKKREITNKMASITICEKVETLVFLRRNVEQSNFWRKNSILLW